ncbi:phage integrase SAM-like domain-containing protein [Marinifilum sp. RC60d5]|uniref:phage integrase SAM-like domain-containing protein n=1 Tax=Marinifilum sp. RC60d5 TaxID=3458414 RepID=UPI00403560DA
MASVKIIFFKHKVFEDGTSPIVLQIIHKRVRRIFSLNHSTTEDRWDEINKEIKSIDKSQKRFVQEMNMHFHSMQVRAKSIILDFEKNEKTYTSDNVIEKLKGVTSSNYISFTERVIKQLKELGKDGNARVYQSNLNVFSKFIKGKDISFDEITYSLVKKFEASLYRKGNGINGVAHQLKTLRAIYNRAIKEGVARKDLYPFENIKIKTEKTAKRALSKDEIIQIRDINLDKKPAQKRARDLFMFSFYCMGMAFVDIAYLKVKDIYKGRLNYSRQKTTQVYNMAIVEPAMEIINKYSTLEEKDEFVFPILDKNHPSIYDLYLSQMRNQNKRLKEIQKKLDLSLPLTSYVARHSWATIAKRSGIPTAVISEGLGHTTEKTTQIYLDSFENEVLDEANKLIVL